jgi:hypothetical protein
MNWKFMCFLLALVMGVACAAEVSDEGDEQIGASEQALWGCSACYAYQRRCLNSGTDPDICDSILDQCLDECHGTRASADQPAGPARASESFAGPSAQSCTPSCSGKRCGTSDGCGGSCAGYCAKIGYVCSGLDDDGFRYCESYR